LLAQLEEDGLREDTIVMVWSDHGMGLPRFKRWPYDTGLRVPLIVRAPGVTTPGTRSRELISLIDLGPTVMALAGLPRPRHFHGRSFLGRDRDPPRECVFAARDRYDESYDKVRSARDDRSRYLCNSYPNLEREIYVPYRNRHPAMQEIWARAATGALDREQAWFAPGPRPAEELYDLDADPWELRNLAGDPACQSELERLRGWLAEWQAKHDPWFDVPEAQMVRMWHPDGVQARTTAPYAIALGPNQPGTCLLASETVLARPVLIQLGCPTEGASLEYQVREADGLSRWRLYAGPVALPAGCAGLRARACRYGFQPSPEAEWRFTLKE
jgi:hypothetical protein